MAEIELKHVSKIYEGGSAAVRDFTLDIHDREFVIFVGPSGCGKSTTLRMIAGLEDVTEGEIYVDGEYMNDVESCDRDMAMVFQNYALYPHMTVFDNIAYSMKLKKVPKEERKRRVMEAAKILGIEELLDRHPNQLSGGQKQRVAMGRAIVRRPKAFLMDEPLSNLDAKLRNQMRTEIRNLHKNLDTTFIYVTHDQVEAMTLGTKIVVMKDSVIQQVASPRELYDYPVNMFVAGFIGTPQMNFLEADCGVKDGKVELITRLGTLVPEKDKGDMLLRKGYTGKKVMIGIRPEDIYDDEERIKNSLGSTIQTKVEVYEMLGDKCCLYCEKNDEKLTASLKSDTKARCGDEVTLVLDLSKMHVFDKDTQMAILH